MKDFFFQIVLFFAGAIIGIAVPLLPRNSQKWILGLLAVFLVVTSLVWAGCEWVIDELSPTVVPGITPDTPIATLLPTPTPVPPTSTPVPPTLTPLPPNNTSEELGRTEATNWAISYTYRFPPGFWSVGEHIYVLKANCPNIEEASGSWEKTFLVSNEADLLPGDVYLRLIGLNDGLVDGNSVDIIHPSQPTTGALTYVDYTHSQVQQFFSDCHVSIMWDRGEPHTLVAGQPYER